MSIRRSLCPALGSIAASRFVLPMLVSYASACEAVPRRVSLEFGLWGWRLDLSCCALVPLRTTSGISRPDRSPFRFRSCRPGRSLECLASRSDPREMHLSRLTLDSPGSPSPSPPLGEGDWGVGGQFSEAASHRFLDGVHSIRLRVSCRYSDTLQRHAYLASFPE